MVAKSDVVSRAAPAHVRADAFGNAWLWRRALRAGTFAATALHTP
jgi:hypothetical protein